MARFAPLSWVRFPSLLSQTTKQPLFGIFLGRRPNARNVGFRNSLQRLLHFGKFTLSTRLIKTYYLIFLSAGIADSFFSGRSMKTKEELKAAEVRFGFSQNFMIQTSCGLAAPFLRFRCSFVRSLLQKVTAQISLSISSFRFLILELEHLDLRR